MTSKEMARKKYQVAVSLIATAESILSEACGELCPLIGAIEEWEAVGDIYELVKDLRRRVDYSSAKDNVDMDQLEEK